MCSRLVEDEWLIRSMVAEELAEGGFKVYEAENGDQALTLIAQDPAVFTLLVTDIHMPGSLNCIEVARLLRARRPDVPVIYTTGRPDVLHALQPLGGKQIVLQKPFELSALLYTVRQLLNRGDDHRTRNAI